jgi:hypothetical protein
MKLPKNKIINNHFEAKEHGFPLNGMKPKTPSAGRRDSIMSREVFDRQKQSIKP